MMMKNRIIIKLILVTLMKFSFFTADADPLSYYSDLNKAISYISSSNFYDAYKTYRKLCKENVKLVKKNDYINMYKCAVLSKKKGPVEELIANNFDFKFVYEDKRVIELNKTYNLKVKSYKDSEEERDPIDDVIDSLMNIDQQVRKGCPGYNINCVKNVIASDSNSAIMLLSIMKNYVSKLEKVFSPQNVFSIRIMIKHWRQWGINWFDDILKMAVLNARFSPDWYASIIDYRSGIDSIDKKFLNSPYYAHGAQCFSVGDTLIVYRLASDEYKKVDSNRSEIHYISLESERKLKWFMLKNNFFKSVDFEMETINLPMSRKTLLPIIDSLKKVNKIY